MSAAEIWYWYDTTKSWVQNHEKVHVRDWRIAWQHQFAILQGMLGPVSESTDPHEQVDCYNEALTLYGMAFRGIVAYVSAMRHADPEDRLMYANPDKPGERLNRTLRRARQSFNDAVRKHMECQEMTFDGSASQSRFDAILSTFDYR